MQKTLSFIIYHLSFSVALCAALTACTGADSELTSGRTDGQQADAVAFTTYMGRQAATRGGAYGAIDTERLAQAGYGFGVFAYQTGADAYADYRTQGVTPEHFPNFMYNVRIVGDGDGGWKYADERDTRYWPNEVATRGQVSFFAYAPYAPQSNTDPTNGITGMHVGSANDGTTSGIIAFSGNLFNGGDGATSTPLAERYQYSDPYLLYRMSTDNKKQVDLLWGTAGANGNNVLGHTQPGMAANSLADCDNYGRAITTGRPAYNVNTDLTKQTTSGTVHLRFKHALSQIGGSYVGIDDGSDEDATTPTNGLMIVLDIDDNKGNATGGYQQPYTETLEEGSNAADNHYCTKVTVHEIVLQSERQLTDEGLDAIGTDAFDYEGSLYTTALYNQGLFNLATGVWHNRQSVGTTSADFRQQTIVPATGDDTTDQAADALLHAAIAEPATHPAYTKAGFESLPIGVTTVPKNVYQSDVQPFVFIPGTYPAITITVDYTVRTYDAKLAKKYTEVRQRITKRLYILDELLLNKRYSILIHLGLTSVKFTATVDDWETTTTYTTTDPDTGQEVTVVEENVEHIYLPANVE